jgi:hypothetical protein
VSDDIAAKVKAKWDEARKDCDCAPYQKPCSYHEGMLDGTDLAAGVWLDAIDTARRTAP